MSFALLTNNILTDSNITGVLVGDGTNAPVGVQGTAGQFLRRNIANNAYEFVTGYTAAEIDSMIQGLDPKASVRAATTVNITLSGTQTIDGVAVIAGDRVLVKDQTTQSQNGVYIVAAGAWSRSSDMDITAEFSGAYMFVEQGTVNADRAYVCTSDNVTVGTTAITFVLFAGSGAYEPSITSGTTAQYWRGDKTWRDFSTDARTAISLTTTGSSGASTYNNTTGVLNIPTYTLAGLGGEPSITAGTTLQYWRGDKSWQTLNTSVIPELTNLYYTDARARAAISLTTTGSSGAATYSAGVFNIPNYTLAGLGGFSSTGSFFIGTTSIAINRASAAQTLTGVSIDGNAGTVGTFAETAFAVNQRGGDISLNATIDSNTLRNGMYRVNSAVTSSPNSGRFWALNVYGNQNNVVSQLASDFQTGETFVRAYNSAWSAWRRVWDSVNLITATSTTQGLVELFSDTVQSVAANAVTATASRSYGVQLNAAGQMVVNVPWTDTVYTHPTQTAIDTGTLSGANVVSRVSVNTLGHTTVVSTRALTPGDIGAQSTLNGTGYVKMSGTTVSYVAGATTNTANTVVERDGSGNFAANVITAILNGNANSATVIPVQGLNNATMNIAAGTTGVYRNENGLGGNQAYAPVLHVGGTDTMWQIQGDYSTSTTLQWRAGYQGTWFPWRTIWHNGNFTPGNYLPLTGGTLTGPLAGTSAYFFTTLAAGTYQLNVTAASGAARDIFLAGVSTISNGFTVRYNGSVMVYNMAGGNLTIDSIGAGVAGNFVVSNGGTLLTRTAAQVLSDIGAAPATGGSYLPLAGGTLTGALTANSTITSNGVIRTNSGIAFALNNPGNTGASTLVTNSSGFLVLTPADGGTNLTLGVGATFGAGNVALQSGDIYLQSNAGFGILSANATRALAITNDNITTNRRLQTTSYNTTTDFGISLDLGGSANISIPTSYSGGWARGLFYHTGNSGGIQGAFGMYGSNTTPERMFMSFGTAPWGNNGLYVKSTNDVGIGTDNPQYKLHVVGTTYITGNTAIDGTLTVGSNTDAIIYGGSGVMIRKQNTYTQVYRPDGGVGIFLGNTDAGNYFDNTNHYFRSRNSATTFLTINTTSATFSMSTASTSTSTGALVVTGGVGIGGALNTGGAIVSAANITAYSDITLKDNIYTVNNALEKTMKLRGVYYNRKDDSLKTRKLGVIAQEIREVLPEVVLDNDGLLSVDYGNIVGVLIEAIKELKQEVEQLKQK